MFLRPVAVVAICIAGVGMAATGGKNDESEVDSATARQHDLANADGPGSIVTKWMHLLLEGNSNASRALTTNRVELHAQHDFPRLQNKDEFRVERVLGNASVAVAVTNSIQHAKTGNEIAFAFWLVQSNGAWLIDMSYVDHPENIEQQLSGLYMGGGVHWHVSDEELTGVWLAGPGPAGGVGEQACGSEMLLHAGGSFALEAWGPAGRDGGVETRRGTWRRKGDRIILMQDGQTSVSRVSWMGADAIVLQPADRNLRDGKYGTHYVRQKSAIKEIKRPPAAKPTPPELSGPLAPMAPVLNPGNGHYYAYIESQNVTWTAACRMAGKLQFQGMTGYLATITSEPENAFLLRQWRSRPHAWIGASDAEQEGAWRWVTGPEIGRLFWDGAAEGNQRGFSDWRSQEPNNRFPSSQDPPDEDFAVFNYEKSGWNDLPNDPHKTVFRPHAYLVEFSK